MIGILFSVLGAVGGVGAISTGWLATKFSNRRILLSSIALGVFMMTITPIIGWTGFTMDVAPVAAIFDLLGLDIDLAPVAGVLGLYFLFVIAIAIRGATSGVAQAMEISIIAQAACAAQGKGAALRVTAGRLAAARGVGIAVYTVMSTPPHSAQCTHSEQGGAEGVVTMWWV